MLKGRDQSAPTDTQYLTCCVLLGFREGTDLLSVVGGVGEQG